MNKQDRQGKLVVISGFSGVGKGTAVRRLVEDFDHYAVSTSMTTRKPREGEIDGVHYYFVTNEEFEKMIREGGLLEHAGYVDHYYGTPKAFVDEMREKGIDVILEIEVQGAMQIKERFPDAVLIFITAPSAAEMVKRLIGRKTETDAGITGRLRRAIDEAELMKKYDYVVVNDGIDDCVRELDRIIVDGTGGMPFYPAFKEKYITDLRRIIQERLSKKSK